MAYSLSALGFSNYSLKDYNTIISKHTWHKKTNRKLTINKDRNGYMKVRMVNDKGERKEILVHRIIAELFVKGKTKDKCYIDHINRIRDDNRPENLKWVTHFENIHNSTKQTPVWSFNPKTGESKLYQNVKEAERGTGIDNRNIFGAMFGHGRGDRKTAGGLYWIKASP